MVDLTNLQKTPHISLENKELYLYKDLGDGNAILTDGEKFYRCFSNYNAIDPEPMNVPKEVIDMLFNK